MAGAPAGIAAGAFRPLPDFTCSTSRATMRPCGPLPSMRASSIPASFASRRASGEEKMRAWPLACGVDGFPDALPTPSPDCFAVDLSPAGRGDGASLAVSVLATDAAAPALPAPFPFWGEGWGEGV